MRRFRLTSVVLCVALSFSLLVSPVSAVDVDSDDYYTLDAVEGGSVSVAPASFGGVALAATGEYTSQLSQIITNQSGQTNYLSMIYSAIIGLSDWRNNLLTKTSAIATNTASSATLLSSIDSKIGGFATESTLSAISGKVATETTLTAFKNLFSTGFFRPTSTVDNPVYDLSFADFMNKVFSITRNGPSGTPGVNSPYNYSQVWFDPATSTYPSRQYSFSGVLTTMLLHLSVDGKDSYSGYQYTLYHYVKQLSEVLANDQDKALRDAQKDNVNQVKQDFISGSSGDTSLGASDFGNLSDVGGTFKDTISLNGQASLGSLTSGLNDANTSGQDWFSEACRSELDAVTDYSATSSVSTFADDGITSIDVNPDPYHMAGFEQNYAWLWGDDE